MIKNVFDYQFFHTQYNKNHNFKLLKNYNVTENKILDHYELYYINDTCLKNPDQIFGCNRLFLFFSKYPKLILLFFNLY